MDNLIKMAETSIRKQMLHYFRLRELYLQLQQLLTSLNKPDTNEGGLLRHQALFLMEDKLTM